ncbi:DUF3558 family protein [Gordonia aichiensis]|uniref:DUF3558 family protein n=1 Tax=Gordonia aichiensis TaxID=36820 RepID=UPI00146152FA
MRRNCSLHVALTAIVAILVLSSTSCNAVEGTPIATAEDSTFSSTTSPIGPRQTDAKGRPLPFSTRFPQRWSKGNDGTSYEPCTAATSAILVANGLDPSSARDAAAADHQTARGCNWSFVDRRLATLSQIVGNQPKLDVYKKNNSTSVAWMSDISAADRRVAVGVTPSISECATFVQSGSAIVVTSAMFVHNPPPIAEICDKAIAFTRATIDQMPE